MGTVLRREQQGKGGNTGQEEVLDRNEGRKSRGRKTTERRWVVETSGEC